MRLRAADLLWHKDESGVEKAEEALRLARAGGWPQPIGYALVAVSMARDMIGDVAVLLTVHRDAAAFSLVWWPATARFGSG